MFEVRHLHHAVYVLILLSASGFALAARAPGLWLLTVAAVGVHLWLYRGGRFRPIPQLPATIATLAAFAYSASHIFPLGQRSAMVIGEFLVLLQIIKLFEQRGNRDLIQIIVLSLLLMTAAAINSATLGFSILLMLYLLIALYTSLLFHLKVEGDRVRSESSLVDPIMSEGAVRRDQRRLNRTLRGLSGVITIVAMVIAAVVFVICPRGSSVVAAVPLASGQTLTGFTEQVNFNEVAKITQNPQVVAHVKVRHNGEPVSGLNTLLLRGLTLNAYNASGDGRWEWTRSNEMALRGGFFDEGWLQFTNPASETADQWEQEISLLPTGTRTLFALPGAMRIQYPDSTDVRYAPEDESLRLTRPPNQPIRYTVVSRNSLRGPTGANQLFLVQMSRGRSVIDPAVSRIARLPEVSGSDEQGLLHERRDPAALATDVDERIADNIYAYLKDNFVYTLDLTAEDIMPGKDPIAAFLEDYKKGHCEYFAGAMTLMCQDLGLTARMVIGFASNDYNSLSDEYIVRQSHAHAWVEVLLPSGVWRTYDPTASSDGPVAEAGLFDRLRHVLDFFEQGWAMNVIGYDNGAQEDLFQGVEQTLTDTAIQKSTVFDNFGEKMDQLGQWMAGNIIAPVMVLMGLVALGAIGWYVYEQWRLRRRAERIGLEALPSRELKELARQLAFYDELLRLLGRRRIARPEHQTPMEFSQSLTFLPNDTYDTIRRLTGVFYRIRYGGARLSAAQQSRLSRVIDRLGDGLTT